MSHKLSRGLFALLLAAVTAASCLACLLCWRFDNKYTAPRPQAEPGHIRLDMDWYDESPFFYLVDGWELYRDKLLAPAELAGETPDLTLYLGRFGGFDLGDPDADPHGQGTYRLTIATDGTPRTYVLELTTIYSRWRLWVNGELMQSVGFGDEDAPRPDRDMISFTAAGEIELVVAVADDDHFYSGMVSPPAFGSPERVGRMTAGRLLLHAAACAGALVIGLMSLLGVLRGRDGRGPGWALALLCLCFCGVSVWPVFQALGLRGDGWSLAQRLCGAGLYLAVIWVQGQICRLPRRAYVPACAVGLALCAALAVQGLVPVASARPLYLFSALLALYKWGAALWLLAAGLWALRRGAPRSRPLLAGSCVLAAALVMDRLLPLHEPILLGWFPELVGGVLVALVAWVAWRDAREMYAERAALKGRAELAAVQLQARAEQYALQREYIGQTRLRLHEVRSHLTLIRHYLDVGELTKLSDYVDALGAAKSGETGRYTGHGLVDAILCAELAKAKAQGVYTELELDPLPEELPLSDDDLTALLMNLLDNAVESCQRLPDGVPRWLYLHIGRTDAALELVVRNAAPAGETGEATGKPDKLGHGFGLPLIREITRRGGGRAELRREEDAFEAVVTLPAPKSQALLEKSIPPTD